ncbi:uncharacterized protein F4822DRAFT_430415 [Hypoxylon trugodes]|uniref:uncharacterized protein n=1 Tax=Hypoxylon trugodes TaxID=326681 RepID=UPI00219FB799|nr:uncharacterized protein F4822DRAFT_430415 [Hypoxylon trugodes]KAI1387669.1 hypothetical protein F4822DRAFT_430415 [Hypoxylon trugodes]
MDARMCAARDSEDEVKEWMEDPRARKGRTAAEFLSDVSLNRIWGYLEDAIEDASYLGPWPERPSEKRIKEDREFWAEAEEAEEAEEEEEAKFNDEVWSDDDDDDYAFDHDYAAFWSHHNVTSF